LQMFLVMSNKSKKFFLKIPFANPLCKESKRVRCPNCFYLPTQRTLVPTLYLYMNLWLEFDMQLSLRSSVCYSVAQASSISALIPAGVLIVALLQLALIWSNYNIQFFVLLMITIIHISVLCIPWQENPSLRYPESHVHA
jgi:hypothetical protein